MVLDSMGKMSLVDDREHVITPGDAIRHKTGVLEHEDLVLGVRNDRGLVLRNLDRSQTLEMDNGIRHCPIQNTFQSSSQLQILTHHTLTSTRPVVSTRPPVAEWVTRVASWFREQLWQATMIDESNLARGDLLADPVRGFLRYVRRKKKALRISMIRHHSDGPSSPRYDHSHNHTPF